MAIKIPNLERMVKTLEERGSRYRDLALDLSLKTNSENEFPAVRDTQEIRVSVDIEAIRNSLFNLFNTMPGQRFLWPDYGLDFYQFLFWPVTENNARIIGERILRTVEKYEPRVNVQNVYVEANPDDNSYMIDLLINIPTLGMSINEPFALDVKGQRFVTLNSSRTK